MTLLDSSRRGEDADSHPLRGSHSGGLSRSTRPLALPDPLYGTVRVSAWATALLATPPFARLAGVSLSDVPGDLLFGHPFPSRLDHTLGVYHLARLARPRDRALQVAALAHDLGHGPFSHLTEPLMRERLGVDHEERSVRLLDAVRAALQPAAARQLSWLDWDEVAALLLGDGPDGRGALLHGRIDYDNADNVARFLLASGLGTPSYDPRALARALRPVPAELLPDAPTVPPTAATDGHSGPARSTLPPARAVHTNTRVYLQAAAEAEAAGWRDDRARVYGFLHSGHQNLAAHAMLRKAVDLAAATEILPPDFFDLTDAEAFAVFSRALDRGLLDLTRRVRAGQSALYRCVWEAEVSVSEPAIPAIFARWRERLALESRLAAEAGLAPHAVVAEALVSGAARALPPVAPSQHPVALPTPPEPPAAPRILHLFLSPSAGSDYVRRLRMAADRHFGPLGAIPREPDSQ